MYKILPLLLFTITLLFSSQLGIVHSLDPNGDGFLSVRTKPKGKEVARLYNGNKVKILSQYGKYYKIKKISSGAVGYAHSNWIRKVVSTSNIITSSHSSSKEGEVYGLDPNGDGFLSLRTKYKTGRQIGKLYEGERVKILAEHGKWYKVQSSSSGKVGWAYSNWVRILKGEKIDTSNMDRVRAYKKESRKERLYAVNELSYIKANPTKYIKVEVIGGSSEVEIGESPGIITSNVTKHIRPIFKVRVKSDAKYATIKSARIGVRMKGKKKGLLRTAGFFVTRRNRINEKVEYSESKTIFNLMPGQYSKPINIYFDEIETKHKTNGIGIGKWVGKWSINFSKVETYVTEIK